MVFTDYTWVGYFIAVSATGYVVLIAMVLKPDVEGDAAARMKDTVSLTEAKTQIVRSRAYISYHVGFINNFREFAGNRFKDGVELLLSYCGVHLLTIHWVDAMYCVQRGR